MITNSYSIVPRAEEPDFTDPDEATPSVAYYISGADSHERAVNPVPFIKLHLRNKRSSPSAPSTLRQVLEFDSRSLNWSARSLIDGRRPPCKNLQKLDAVLVYYKAFASELLNDISLLQSEIRISSTKAGKFNMRSISAKSTPIVLELDSFFANAPKGAWDDGIGRTSLVEIHGSILRVHTLQCHRPLDIASTLTVLSLRPITGSCVAKS